MVTEPALKDINDNSIFFVALITTFIPFSSITEYEKILPGTNIKRKKSKKKNKVNKSLCFPATVIVM